MLAEEDGRRQATKPFIKFLGMQFPSLQVMIEIMGHPYYYGLNKSFATFFTFRLE